MLKVEFIHTCPCCDTYTQILKDIAKEKKEIDLKLYYAGKDFDYIAKYGPVTKGTLIINEKDSYDESTLNKTIINEIIEKALEESRI